jgi:hypothetical protein
MRSWSHIGNRRTFTSHNCEKMVVSEPPTLAHTILIENVDEASPTTSKSLQCFETALHHSARHLSTSWRVKHVTISINIP